MIMESPIQILVTDHLPVRELVSDDLADGYAVQFDINYSEYDLMANRQYNEMQYSQELNLATYPVVNGFMPYCYHM
jgi:hypothetical protein